MMVEDKHVYLDKQEMKKSKLRRCPLCGEEQDLLHPMVINLNDKSWVKLNEIAKFGIDFKLRNTSHHNPKINKSFDDLTLQLINGPSYEVNLDMCLDCTNKIGYRHKFKGKRIQKLYATKSIQEVKKMGDDVEKEEDSE